MNRKYGVTVISVFVIIFFASLYTRKEKISGKQSPISFEWEGEGRNPMFRGSAVFEIRLRKDIRPEDVKIFVNQKQRECEWQYYETAQIYLKEQGKYKIRAEYKGECVYEETVIVELENPTTPKVSIKNYKKGEWSKNFVSASVYGACALSGIEKYEYKIGDGEWRSLKKKEFSIERNMDDMVSIRAISCAGREGALLKIPVRLWTTIPAEPTVCCSEVNKKGNWYREFPQFSYDLLHNAEGPEVDAYFRLTDLTTKDQWTRKNQVPKIKNDGNYQLMAWSVDKAGNHSKKVYYSFGVDTQKPKISVEYKIPFPEKNILKTQKAIVYIRDANLKKGQIGIETTGRQIKDWIRKGSGYWTEIYFEGNRMHDLTVRAEDFAGNQTEEKEKLFETDLIKPRIYVKGVRNRGSYKKAINLKIEISDLHMDSENTQIYLNQREWIPEEITRDGHYILRIRAKDFAGNEKEKYWNFTLNQKGIQIAFLQNHLAGRPTNHKNLKPSFMVESLEPVQVEGFFINGKKADYVWENDRITAAQELKEDGNYKLELRLRDMEGNQKRSKKIYLIYDTKKPGVMIRGLDENNSCEYGDSLEIYLHNQSDQIKILKVDGVSERIFHNRVVLDNLEPGLHKLYVEAYDRAGNILKRKIQFTVTKAVPGPVKEILRRTKSSHGEKKGERQKIFLFCLTAGSCLIFCVRIIKNRRTRL